MGTSVKIDGSKPECISLAESEEEIARCQPVLVQLRPHIAAAEFVGRVRELQPGGYRLAYLEDDGRVRAVAGFRISNMLSRDRFLYVDDLVTDARLRSRGYGDALFDWLVEYARSQGCTRLDLDSGVQRTDAHRFYFRKRMQIASFHFSLALEE